MAQFPSTVEELVHSIWYSKLKTLIRNFHLHEPEEDTLNDILLQMLEKKYLERWDANHGSFSNWLYTFASNICRKKYNRSNTLGGRAIENAASIVYAASDDFQPSRCYEERLATAFPNFDYSVFVNQISTILQKYPAHSSNVVDGVEYKRDMQTAFLLLAKDFNVKEVSELFGTSSEFVYTLVRKMRVLISKEI